MEHIHVRIHKVDEDEAEEIRQAMRLENDEQFDDEPEKELMSEKEFEEKLVALEKDIQQGFECSHKISSSDKVPGSLKSEIKTTMQERVEVVMKMAKDLENQIKNWDPFAEDKARAEADLACVIDTCRQLFGDIKTCELFSNMMPGAVYTKGKK